MRGTRFLSLAAGALLALTACGPGGGTMNADGGGEGGTVTAPPREFTYVLNALSVDMSEDPAMPHTGFNLDNLFSNGMGAMDCQHEDYFSTIDTDQNCMMPAATGACPAGAMNTGCMASNNMGACRGGVDNQLPVLASTIEAVASMDVRALITNQINSSGIVLLVRLSDVNGDLGPTLNDDSVVVRLYVGYPTFTSGCTSVMADREYQVARSSLRTGGTTLDDAKFEFRGSIVNGRLRVQSMAPFPLPLPEVMGVSLQLDLQNALLRADLAADNTAARGNLGGGVLGQQVVDTVARAFPQFLSTVQAAISGLIDIQQAGVCADRMSNPARYGAIGLGLGFTTVKARISTATPIADRAMPGACGASASGGGG